MNVDDMRDDADRLHNAAGGDSDLTLTAEAARRLHPSGGFPHRLGHAGSARRSGRASKDHRAA
ncbi:hypothetical protein [Streptomyces sp. NPDC087512]|uniref:hypothetical protein n=1 Tax=unclassified Streptomyces TaxID=2593676 RepID=UPI003412BB4D